MATEQDRRDTAFYKAQVYKSCAARLFIEGHHAEAGRIAAESGKPVICMDTMSLIQPEGARLGVLSRQEPALAWRSKVSMLKLSVRGLVGDKVYRSAKTVYTGLRGSLPS